MCFSFTMHARNLEALELKLVLGLDRWRFDGLNSGDECEPVGWASTFLFVGGVCDTFSH